MNRRRRTFVVSSAATTTQVFGNSTTTTGVSTTFTAQVTGGPSTPQGTVDWYVDGAFVTNDTLDAFGQVSRGFTFTTSGNHTVAAFYLPANATWLASNGSTVCYAYLATATSTVLQAGSSVQYGATQILQSTTTPNPGSGYTVNFYVDGVNVGSSTTNASGIATFNIGNSRSVGTYNIGAIFSQSAPYQQSGSTNNNTYSITQATVSISLTSSNNPSDYGQAWGHVASVSSSTGVNVVGDVEFWRAELNSLYVTEPVVPLNGSASSFVSGTYTSAAHPLDTVWKARFMGSTNFAATAFTADHTHSHTKQDSSITVGVPMNFNDTNNDVNNQNAAQTSGHVHGGITWERTSVSGTTVTAYYDDGAGDAACGTSSVAADGTFTATFTVPAGIQSVRVDYNGNGTTNGSTGTAFVFYQL